MAGQQALRTDPLGTLARPQPVGEAERQEIAGARQMSSQTLRPTVAELEAILFEPIPVLDHGFLRVIDYMGDDAAVVQ
ncbi:MAG TPA: thymidylate synthase (FAD), partial [Beijerinckia sp.]|nr:thymidylate synthase (FAD) [Beijerinckia sp.]